MVEEGDTAVSSPPLSLILACYITAVDPAAATKPTVLEVSLSLSDGSILSQTVSGILFHHLVWRASHCRADLTYTTEMQVSLIHKKTKSVRPLVLLICLHHHSKIGWALDKDPRITYFQGEM